MFLTSSGNRSVTRTRKLVCGLTAWIPFLFSLEEKKKHVELVLVKGNLRENISQLTCKSPGT